MNIILPVLIYAGISLAVYLSIACLLILSQWPPVAPRDGGLDFGDTLARKLALPKATEKLIGQTVRHYKETGPLVVLVHGSGWHGLQFDGLARALSAAGLDVLVPDLRGHGATPDRRGDVDYIGQLEDDLAALIEATRQPGQAVILAGHSSGGGLVVRFAGGKHRNAIDAAVLMAPFLKYNAATTRQNSGGWAHPLIRRIIGLSMLNNIGVRALNGLTVIQFAFPEAVRSGPLADTVTDAYSFRLNTSFAPRSRYLRDIAALPRFLLIAGRKDEAFIAEGFEPLMSKVSDRGQYLLVDNVSHLDIVDAPQTAVAIIAFVADLPVSSSKA